MSDGIQIQLRGADDVKAALLAFKDYLPKKYLRTALQKAAQFLQGFIVLAAPKRTGRLARNIVVKIKSAAGRYFAHVVVNTVGKDDNPQNAFYWRFLEKGFHDRAGKEHEYPFIRGVMDAKEREAAQIVIDSVGDAVAKAKSIANRS